MPLLSLWLRVVRQRKWLMVWVKPLFQRRFEYGKGDALHCGLYREKVDDAYGVVYYMEVRCK